MYLCVIPIGYATRKQPHLFYAFIAKYGGDVLWATMFFFLFRFFMIHSHLGKVVLYTYAFCVGIEISQLYHAPWIDEIRKTFLGKMLLGSGFLWSDIVCYLIGILLGYLIATLLEKFTSYVT